MKYRVVMSYILCIFAYRKHYTMRILYDHQMFTMQKFGGVTRYFAELMACLPSDFTACMPPTVWSDNYYLQEIVGQQTRQLSRPHNFRLKRRIYYFLNDLQARKTTCKNDYDIMHPTWYAPYVLKGRKRPLVITVHDMIQELFTDDFLFYDRSVQNKRRLIQEADHIIAVSGQTKKDILDITGIDTNKISVVHHGYRPTVEPSAPLAENYILYVGDRRKYKNFGTFITGVAPLLHREKALAVICAGADFNDEEVALFHSLNIPQTRVRAIRATDAQLMSLYRHAQMFVYPSLYEGFGIPILEAFANECPVCLSNASCFPEVAGEAALYFDPQSPQSIQNAIESILYNHDEAERLRIAGRERVRQFSIERMVSSTCDIYKSMV